MSSPNVLPDRHVFVNRPLDRVKQAGQHPILGTIRYRGVKLNVQSGETVSRLVLDSLHIGSQLLDFPQVIL
jgi:hypothetical protein